MSTETSCHFGHFLQVSKKSLLSLILYIFFHDFIHAYSPRAGADSPQGTKFWCQQKCLVTSLICCKFKKMSLKSDFIQLFHDLMHVYSPGQGQTAPRGQNFDVNRRALSFYPFVASFKGISLKSNFIQFFFMILCMYIARGRGIQPPGDKVLMSTETSCHFGHLLLVSNHRWQ